MAGHRLGEYTALVAAGALDARTSARLVQTRGEAMQVAADTNPGTMAAVLGLDLEGVARACDEATNAWVANDNTPGQVVVAGTLSGVEEAGAAALRHGAKRVIPWKWAALFYTPLMQPAQAPLDAALAGVDFLAIVYPRGGTSTPLPARTVSGRCSLPTLLACQVARNRWSQWRIWGPRCSWNSDRAPSFQAW